jgi:cytochrome P450
MHRLQQGEPLSSRSSSMLSARVFTARARLRNCKPAARVELTDRVPAWAIGNYSLVRQLLADPRVSRNARPHWSARKLGEIPKNWPPRLWAEIEHMGTANGGDHRRLRSLMSCALKRLRHALDAVDFGAALASTGPRTMSNSMNPKGFATP